MIAEQVLTDDLDRKIMSHFQFPWMQDLVPGFLTITAPSRGIGGWVKVRFKVQGIPSEAS
jgi:hypothetical protein